jgi:branched-chain amino acid transport system permease protein
MNENTNLSFREIINLGLIASAVSLSFSAIGLVGLFSERDLVAGVISMGEVFLFAPAAISGYLASRKGPNRNLALMNGLLVGAISSALLIILIILATVFNLRQFLPNVSPALIELMTFNLGPYLGSVAVLFAGALLGFLAAVMDRVPDHYSDPILKGLFWTLIIGMFSEILSERLRTFFGIGLVRLLFVGKALNPITALFLFILITGLSVWWRTNGDRLKARYTTKAEGNGKKTRLRGMVAAFVVLAFLPLLLGNYLSEVTNNVLIYVLMGFGLNIVVGFAGLLDLGYVAFFAIGAYTMAILTSTSELGVFGLSFWAAIPICILVAVMFGIFLGIPVLRMRGDYLAIVTLGFGEIIRILALSDMLKPFIGGAQGILQINKPIVLGTDLVQPTQFYYVVLIGCLLAAFVSWRLRDSRLGRQWMALREDEDVAEAMGINLVKTKLMAFAIGAAFSGLSGAIFASKLTSIFPHSFGLLVSINVLCLIIIGGMGSLPGVVVGALALVGLPELLREFAEYRLLAYGAILIVMMLAKPEGLWPSEARKRELHVHEEIGPNNANVAEVES